MPDVFVTGEPTGLNLATTQKSRVTLDLHAHGRGAHTSQPELGENAVYKMIEGVRRLQSLLMREDADLGREILELVAMISVPYPNPGMVPHGCIAHFNGRILPEETQTSFLRWVEAALSGLYGIDAAIPSLSAVSYTG